MLISVILIKIMRGKKNIKKKVDKKLKIKYSFIKQSCNFYRY